jgi:hypothetical protein
MRATVENWLLLTHRVTSAPPIAALQQAHSPVALADRGQLPLLAGQEYGQTVLLGDIAQTAIPVGRI